jgi:hypothetical protein
MKGKVVHSKKEPYDVYIGRGSAWGNPFKIGVHGDRDEVIKQYEKYIRGKSELMERAKKELFGKVLGCWCAPKPCHGDILLKIANGG